jgi:hypothetical protein
MEGGKGEEERNNGGLVVTIILKSFFSPHLIPLFRF